MQVYAGGFSTRAAPQPGDSRSGRWFNGYIDKPCRISGEIDCFHFEGKYCGVQYLRRIGLDHPRDLVDFDFDAHFSKNMVLHDLDFERLGRHYDNRQSGTKRKKRRISKHGRRFIYNHDARLGGTLYHALAVHPHQQERTLQQFVDQHGRGPFLRPVLLYDHVRKWLTSQAALTSHSQQ